MQETAPSRTLATSPICCDPCTKNQRSRRQKADATGEKSATADTETATVGSTAAGAESAAEESSTPKAHTTANESIAAGVEAAAEEESTTTDAEPAEAAT